MIERTQVTTMPMETSRPPITQLQLVSFVSSELDPGESMTVRIEFNPNQPGAKIAQVVVLTNDFDNGADITLRVEGLSSLLDQMQSPQAQDAA